MNGATGVHRSGRRYAAAIGLVGRLYHLGTYDRVSEASVAYDSAAWHIGSYAWGHYPKRMNYPFFDHNNPPPLFPRIRELRDRLCREGLINL